MNIWILNHYACTPDGQATRSFDLGSKLVKNGHNVTVFASSFSHYSLKEERFHTNSEGTSKVEYHDGVRFIWIRTTHYSANNWRRLLNTLTFAWRGFWIGKRFHESPDIIIGTSVHLFTPLSAYLLSKIKKCRFVFEVTDLWPETLVDMGLISRENPITWVLKTLEKFLYTKASAIITLTPHADIYITNLGIPQDKIVWIPNGVVLQRYDSLNDYDGGNPDKFNVMYIGGHLPAYGLDTILKAAKIIQDDGESRLRITFVGGGADKIRLVKYAQKLKLHNVKFHNPVPKSQVPEVMKEADAFIHTIRDLPVLKYGISSNKLCDYLASRRPIIFAINAANNPVQESGAGISVSPENPAYLSHAIKTIMSMKPEERVEMGNKGLEYAKKTYDIDVLADKLERMLKNLKDNPI